MTGIFRRNIRCALLWILGNQPIWLQTRDYHPLWYGFPADSSSPTSLCAQSKPHISMRLPPRIRFALCGFRSTLLPASRSMSFPPGTRMLRFPGCPFLWGTIRRSWDQTLLAGTPRLSQLATSFIGFQAKPFSNRLLESLTLT